ncbi:MAG: efflux RND transporter periplasmic adaptor subunit [Thermoanaerobaculia bacterium]|nr:efflux RND transporter periplasmic adaptor subunit [Thermoanaerobaculia bacterium]MCZ7652850.1 efflux RND transporter periplasmic adaptor subunit [Thermoanaerobaculia bacterium]
MSPKRIVPPLLLLALAGFLVWRFGLAPRHAEPGLLVSGTVEATEARLGFELPGRLVEVLPREGDRVAAGDPLARLDAAELAARRVQAAAQVDGARAQLAELEAGSRPEELAAARAALAAADERVADAARDVERARRLHDGRAISREALDKAEAGLEIARAQRAQAAEQAALVAQGPRRERIDAARAALATAEAAVATLDAALAKTALAAPFAGLVTVRHREPGEIVAAGAAVVTLMDPDDRWVRIYVPENRLGAVALGAAVEIASDTFPGRRYRGEVAHVASAAEFTPKNVQTAEERVRLVYAVKVRVVDDPALELKPGLPADVRLPLETE